MRSPSASDADPAFLRVSRVARRLQSSRQSVSWVSRLGKPVRPRFSPEEIWYTAVQVSVEARLPRSAVLERLYSRPEFVRASNLRAQDGEPVCADKVAYRRSANPAGRLASILVNKIVG
jgi:hypothetical protein